MSMQSVGVDIIRTSLDSLQRVNEFASPMASEVIRTLNAMSAETITSIANSSNIVGPLCFMGSVAVSFFYGKHKAALGSNKIKGSKSRGSESPTTTMCSPLSGEFSPIEKERSFSQDSLERDTSSSHKKLPILSHTNKKRHDEAVNSRNTASSSSSIHIASTTTPATTHATATTDTLFSGGSTQHDLYNNYGHTPYARSSSPAHSSSILPPHVPSPAARSSSSNMNVTLVDGDGAPIPHGAQIEVRYPKSQYVAQRPLIVRFPLNGNYREDAFYYFRNRATEALVEGLILQDLREAPGGWGVEATFRFDIPSSVTYHSLYVYERHRRKGHYKSWLARNGDKTILVLNPSGEVQAFLKHCERSLGLQVRFKVLQHTVRDRWIEYRLIQDFYGDHVAKRTSAHLMNHIDEGLWVLRYMRASELAMRAYVLHPMVQGDADFADFMERLRDPADKARLVDRRVLALAAEYRSVANEYLSSNRRRKIRLSPLREVNDMLIADKVQNRKDFEIYHSSTHDKKDRLAAYFAEWLEALEVSEDIYSHCKSELIECVCGKGRAETDAFEY